MQKDKEHGSRRERGASMLSKQGFSYRNYTRTLMMAKHIQKQILLVVQHAQRRTFVRCLGATSRSSSGLNTRNTLGLQRVRRSYGPNRTRIPRDQPPTAHPSFEQPPHTATTVAGTGRMMSGHRQNLRMPACRVQFIAHCTSKRKF